MDIAANSSHLSIRTGYDPQNIEIGGMEIVNFGDKVKLEQLPATQPAK